ncbi:MAG: GHKL domain-containing protein [Sedimentisphaerales bacterium]|nr:GHKL domain-containing protein [Sedimentisphaerales bacterium]
MYRRLVILTVIIVAALGALSALGHHAVTKWAQGLEGVRLGEFAEVAEQIREDVKRKLDDFIAAEQQRKYTDYFYYYVPENVVTAQQQLPVLRSPLNDQFSNGFAYGYFQVEPGGRIVTPYSGHAQAQAPVQAAEVAKQIERIETNIKDNLLPSVTSPSGALRLQEVTAQALRENEARRYAQAAENTEVQMQDMGLSKGAKSARGANYDMGILNQDSQRSQIITQQRQIAMSNKILNEPPKPEQPRARSSLPQAGETSAQQAQPVDARPLNRQQARPQPEPVLTQAEQQAQTMGPLQDAVPPRAEPSETVQIRIEPFFYVPVPGDGSRPSIFGGQVFLLRHVQIEDSHLLQGFQLDEARLVEEVRESATRFMREGMDFDLPQVSRASHPRFEGETPSTQRGQDARDTVYTAILDFGFGDLVLALREIDPGWITKRIAGLQRVYLGIIAVVAVAVALALGSLWHNVRAQAQLAQKKDDFISAVSHELRTPLTSIRMYSEMLEKGWVKSTEKLSEYYRSMRAESERLSRLVENVLDFSRIQKGRKKYAFQLGDVNACVTEVIAMMRPYAEQHGFAIETDLAPLGETPFDKDAVTQIVVNLIDNAVKYAHAAQDKTILLRTRREGRYTVIEVEDHGPGIPNRQRKKVFEQFYRVESGKCQFSSLKSKEAPPTSNSKLDTSNSAQTTGTGLGLALVKRFAEAHDGFVEIRSAQPSGVTLKVALAAQV